ncbi:MAG TPA: redoxin domain-containing protein [Planctomycetaceae bacterium]|nr:redoxin domain-containing protein [Planctomycetaceae bacterium]
MRSAVRLRDFCVALVVFAAAGVAVAEDVTTLPIGAAAPELALPGVDGKTYHLKDFADAELLVVVFTCNHCPTAQAYEERIIQLHRDYSGKNVALVAISPNDPLAVRLDELGYTDVGDSFEDMKLHAERRGFKFPYLYDGETQRVSKAFGVLATPHVFLFDRQRKLRYNGRIDDSDIKPPASHDARNAIGDLLAGREVRVPKTRVFGCSTKWADKRDSARAALAKWEAEPVELKKIDAAGVRKLAANETGVSKRGQAPDERVVPRTSEDVTGASPRFETGTGKFRLINLWSTTCVPCIAELEELVTVHRMYRGRHFELVTISTDAADRSDAALKLLKQNHVSCTNYIFDSDDLDTLAEALDPKWEGPLPYTVLIAPGGEIVRRWRDAADPAELKSEIVDRLGRTYASRKPQP